MIAATNRSLDAEVTAGRFRADLLHRLAVVRVRIPPLRERKEDLPQLVRATLDALGPKARGFSLSPETLRSLAHHEWPGNVRELRNLVERLMIMVPGERITARDVAFLDQGMVGGIEASTPAPSSSSMAPLHDARDRFERDYILRALAAQQGNISRTADALGIERSNLYRKMRAFGIMPARKSEDEETV